METSERVGGNDFSRVSGRRINPGNQPEKPDILQELAVMAVLSRVALVSTAIGPKGELQS